MTTVREAAEALETVLKTVEVNGVKVRVYRNPAAEIDPPGVVLGAPSLSWAGYRGRGDVPAPTSATFPVYVVARIEDRSMESLWDLVPVAAAVLESVADAVTTSADPGAYDSGGRRMPCYELLAEVSL